MSPAARILLWVASAIAIQRMQAPALVASAGVLIAAALVFQRDPFLVMMRRVRWLLVAMVALFAMEDSGRASLFGTNFWITIGLQNGVVQGLRLLGLIAVLALLISPLAPKNIVGAVYTLLRPFQSRTFPVERLSLRLALTLQAFQAEAPLKGAMTGFSKRVADALHQPLEEKTVHLRLQRPTVGEIVILGSAFAAALWMPL